MWALATTTQQQAREYCSWLTAQISSTTTALMVSGLDPQVAALFRAQLETYQHLLSAAENLVRDVRAHETDRQLRNIVFRVLVHVEPTYRLYMNQQKALRQGLLEIDDEMRLRNGLLEERLRLYRHGRRKLLNLVRLSEVDWDRTYRDEYLPVLAMLAQAESTA